MSWEIFHGPKKVAFDPPPDWRLLPSTWPEDQTGPDDGPTGLTRQALDHPLDISLEDKILPGGKVALVTDDGARQTPIKDMLPVVIDRLAKLGVPGDNIDIIVAAGNPRGHGPGRADGQVRPTDRGRVPDSPARLPVRRPGPGGPVEHRDGD